MTATDGIKYRGFIIQRRLIESSGAVRHAKGDTQSVELTYDQWAVFLDGSDELLTIERLEELARIWIDERVDGTKD